ncbi:hypothetical protein [Desulfonatronum thioautotrophicum]|uniref:hypothetical protein n=1 Tax=Desulfonatronum thioautotrophicum TaxID=617001 RepID=UPI0005EB5B6B|nr:hypothetical protein [Desulfonatronum thioautotrophicum]
MIDKNSAIPAILERLTKLPQGHCLEIRTYKRNRRVLFHRVADNAWNVHQDGFAKDFFENIALEKLRKLLQGLLRKEFPRSTKIRLYALGPCDPEVISTQGRKVL